jgi:hypothetical protein
MGHDHSYNVPLSLELSLAWKKYGVLNPSFSPMRCFGLPLWANPLSANFSPLHFFSLFFTPQNAIFLTFTFDLFIAYLGAFLFSTLFINNFFINLCFAAGWALQAHLVSNAIVGHMNYMLLGYFPFLFYFICVKQKNVFREFVISLILVFLLSQFIFSGAQPALIIWSLSFVFTLATIKLLGKTLARTEIHWKYLLKRNSVVILISALLVLPKVMAVFSFMLKYPRQVSFLNVGILKVLEYSFYNLIIPTPFDAQTSVGWWFGNWESNQALFPCLGIFLFLFLFLKKDYQTLKKLSLFLVIIFFVSVFINSGIYSELFSMIPFLKSLHINPRWNTILLLPTFAGYAVLIGDISKQIKQYIVFFFLILFLLFPYLYVNKTQNQITYSYLAGYNTKLERLTYCYEPVFGYGLEQFPEIGFKLKILGDQFIDPRCYLTNSSCLPGTILNESDKKNLLQYRLK